MVYLIFFGRIEVKMGKKFYLKDTKLTRKIKRIMKKKKEHQGIDVLEYREDDINETQSPKKEYYFKLSASTLFFSAAIIIVITVFLSFFVADRLFYGGYFAEKSNKVSFDRTVDYRKVAKFQDVLNFIRKNYYLEYDENELLEGALKGLVDALGDPYSNYFEPGSMDDYNDYITGTYRGIGVEVQEVENGLKVTNVFEDTPSWRVGIKKDDVITHINGKAATEMSSEERSNLLGKEGNEVILTVVTSSGKTVQYDVKVEVIKKQTVFTKYYDNGIAYIQITQFDDDTGKEFENVINEILKKDTKGLILDLRNNGGGFESQASIVADVILPEGVIAYSEDRNGKKIKEIKSDKSELDLPIVMLINQNTASASELVAGAFRDFEKGVIIGVKSYGKALGQVSKTYEVDGSGIVLTVARYFTPSGQCIHDIGIEPDIKVELAEEYKNISPDKLPFDFDDQLQRALMEIEKMI